MSFLYLSSVISCYYSLFQITSFLSILDFHLSMALKLKNSHCVSICHCYFQKIATCDKDIYTAPVFRSRPDTAAGFLPGGFWKYSAKPSNILPFNEDPMDDETEGKHTIQDDVVVAGQDFTAGLVRMGILPRLRYLLEVKIN